MTDIEEALAIIWDRCQHCKDVQEALEILRGERPQGGWRFDGTEYEDGKVTAICVSNELHGLERARFVPERPRGKWIEKEDFNQDIYYDCSVCGNSWCTLDGTPWQNGMNFCPNCGARMIKKEGEEK